MIINEFSIGDTLFSKMCLSELYTKVKMFLSLSVPTHSTPLFRVEFSERMYLWKPHAKADVLRPFGVKFDHK